MEKRRHKTIAALIIVFLLACLVFSFFFSIATRRTFFSGGPTPETLGLEVARAKGCFQCHGDFGTGGTPNPGNDLVPSWQGFTFMMSMENEQDLREWILDGAPQKIRSLPSYAQKQRGMTLHMPAYRGRLTKNELNHLVALYHAVSGTIWPEDSEAEKGYEVADGLGCFACHGPGGRFDLPNPDSLTGTIPSWNGADYEDLVKNEQELRNWILDGRIERIERSFIGQWFTTRQAIQMPAYRDKISDEDLDAIVAYIQWLRNPDAPGHTPSFTY